MISVVVCTYNHCQSLQKTLTSLAQMSVPPDVAWELVVIDNNSRDATPQAVDDFSRTVFFPVRYHFEGKQGLSHARNRGIAEASGEIVAFTDDDITVDPRWLGNIARAFFDPRVEVVGGKILPIWELPPPPWLARELYGCLALLDYGPDVRVMETAELWGANFSVRRSVFERHGLFNTGVGRTPGKLYGGEETELLGKVIKSGGRALYDPTLIVHHFIERRRLSKAYFRKWKIDNADLEGRMGQMSKSMSIFGIPRWMIKELFIVTLRWMRGSLFYRNNRFVHELHILSILSFMRGRLSSRLCSRLSSE
jgi:glycosyltransferase involved in cell wall biosynthesis